MLSLLAIGYPPCIHPSCATLPREGIRPWMPGSCNGYLAAMLHAGAEITTATAAALFHLLAQ